MGAWASSTTSGQRLKPTTPWPANCTVSVRSSTSPMINDPADPVTVSDCNYMYRD